MLVSIVGSPSSGKTTTAAKAFAWLKDRSMLAEFITEQARLYIVQKRFETKQPITLLDEDQVKIMERQLHVETVMKEAVDKDTFVISDSSALNALLYMTPEALQDPWVKTMTRTAKALYDRVYYAEPLPIFVEGDSNRLHSEAFSREFDRRVPELCDLAELTFDVRLSGSSEKRMWSVINNLILGES